MKKKKTGRNMWWKEEGEARRSAKERSLVNTFLSAYTERKWSGGGLWRTEWGGGGGGEDAYTRSRVTVQ